MLIGYGRVSTAEQNPAHQIDALKRAGVAETDIHLDTASGAKASRPKLDLVLRLLRDGDTLVVTRLDRLGRSVLHLVLLGAELRDRGIGLRVVEQGIDTSTAEGRAMFGMLSVLAELQRELIVANTRDGLAAARARGRRGGRPAKLTADQVRQAQRLYNEGEHTVAQIAAILGVKRGTLYGHLDKTTVGARPRAPRQHTSADQATDTATLTLLAPAHPEPADPPIPRPVPARVTPAGQPPTPAETALRDRLVRQRAAMCASRCPTCGHEPVDARDRWQQRQDLAITWLRPDPDHPGQLVEQHHCAQCQPHTDIDALDCARCGDGPMLIGPRTPAVLDWLTDHGWRHHPDTDQWTCPNH